MTAPRDGSRPSVRIGACPSSPEHDRDLALAAAANQKVRSQQQAAWVRARETGCLGSAQTTNQVLRFTREMVGELMRGGPFQTLTAKQRQALLNILGLDCLPPLPEGPAVTATATGGYDPRSLPRRPPARRPGPDQEDP